MDCNKNTKDITYTQPSTLNLNPSLPMPRAVFVIPLYGAVQFNCPCTCSLVFVMSSGKVTGRHKEDSNRGRET